MNNIHAPASTRMSKQAHTHMYKHTRARQLRRQMRTNINIHTTHNKPPLKRGIAAPLLSGFVTHAHMHNDIQEHAHTNNRFMSLS